MKGGFEGSEVVLLLAFPFMFVVFAIFPISHVVATVELKLA